MRHTLTGSFINANIFKYKTTEKYDLIWSAGLFDYLNDRRFIFLLNKLYTYLKPEGVLYVGNFSDQNRPGNTWSFSETGTFHTGAISNLFHSRNKPE